MQSAALAPDRLDRVEAQRLAEVPEELLGLASNRAVATATTRLRPPAAGPLANGVHPQEHPLTPRSRPAVQNRDMAWH